MAATFNEESDLRAQLTFLNGADNWDLNNILQSANRRVSSRFGREIEERLRPETVDGREFYLSFNELRSFSRLVLDDELVPEAEYTVDTDYGTVTITQSYFDKHMKGLGYRLNAFYVPEAYADLELLYALERILSLTTVQTNDEMTNNRLEQVRRDCEDVTKEILSNTPIPDPELGKRIFANRRRITNY